jgi:hypothetical protein
VTLSLSFDAVERTAPAIYEMAMRHGLVFYDPQSDHVALPPSLAGKTVPTVPRQLLVLRIAGTPPNLGATLLLDGRPLAAAVVASRREAHAQARQDALSLGLDHYQVEDPASLAQSMRWVPVAGDGSGPGDTAISELRIAEPEA